MKKKQRNIFMLLVLTVLLALSPVLPYLPGSAETSAAVQVTQSREDQDFSWDNATVYFTMTDRFEDGNPSNNNSYGRVQQDAQGKNIGTFHGGDLKGLTNKINEGYFTDLGINAIWITAPYEQIHGWVGGGSGGDFAHYAYHGYYALDYTTVDQNMGTVAEMREFVDTAHENGIRVVLDIVMNHPGYNTIKDMHEYNFGEVNVPENWTPQNGQTWHDVHDYINYDNADAWKNWWGQWVRAGIEGYEPGGNSETTMNLAGLPDFRTDLTYSVGLPPLLVNKWNQESNGQFDDWILPSAKVLRRDLNIAPADYIVEWLSAWVEEFGIDGFRVDTAKHVEVNRWAQLKDAANAALWTWRENNPDAPGAQWTDDFWMTGEVWGHGVGKSHYFNNGFDSVINFTFQGESSNGPSYNLGTMEQTFSHYANEINSDPSFNVLSYISQHDTRLYPRDRLVDGGTYLMLLPGAVQVFYGDETARQFGPTGSDSHQGTRSSMNWDSINHDVLNNWKKMGQFRNNHLSIGAGQHKQISSSPYTFSRTYIDGNYDDRVVVVVGASGNTTVDVSSIFSDGDSLRDFYTGETDVVQNGRVTFQAHQNGTILIERASVNKPSVSATPDGGEFEGESLDVTLSLSGAELGAYTLDGTDPKTNGTAYANGDSINIGKEISTNQSITLRLYAENEAGDVAKEYTFTKSPVYPQVSTNPPGGTFSGDSLEVTLHTKNANKATYSINGSTAIIYNDGDKIVIGEGAQDGEQFVLTLQAENEHGTVLEEYTFTKNSGLTVYFKKPANWVNPHIYFYETNPIVSEPTWATAPQMEHVNGDWYTYTINDTESAYIIFKDSYNNQLPAQGQPGLFRDTVGWFDGQWHESNPDQPVKPNAPQNLTITEVNSSSVWFNWEAPIQTVEKYKLFRDGQQVAETTSTNYRDEGLQPETSYVYTVVAVNDVGESPASVALEITTRSESENLITIYYKTNWSSPHIHYSLDSGEWTQAPGVRMDSSEYNGFAKITINATENSQLHAAFNDGAGQWDSNGGTDYTVGTGVYTIQNGQIIEGEPVVNQNTVTIYYRTDWQNSHIHYALNGGQWTQAPGVSMKRSVTYPGYSEITIELGDASGLQAVFNNGSGTWDNNSGNNYQFSSQGVYTLSYGNITNGTP